MVLKVLKFLWKWATKKKKKKKKKKNIDKPKSLFRRAFDIIRFLFRHWKSVLVTIIAWNIGWYMGWFMGRFGEGSSSVHQKNIKVIAPKKRHQKIKIIWSCPIHRQIHKTIRGKCPICSRSLIRHKLLITKRNTLQLTQDALTLAKIKTSFVIRKPLFQQIRTRGQIHYIKSYIREIFAPISGHFRSQLANNKKFIQQGDYIGEIIKSSQDEKLLHKKLYTPIRGMLLEQTQKTHIKKGMLLYKIVDPSQVHIALSIDESKLSSIYEGQQITIHLPIYPTRQFKGILTFISPSVDPKHHTIKVLAKLNNNENLLKEGMSAYASIYVPLNSKGSIKKRKQFKKWSCLIHPEITSNKKILCPLCQLPLKLKKQASIDLDPLVIPDTAPLFTHNGAIVYIQIPHSNPPAYEGKSVVLGSHINHYYILLAGLQKGDLVVSNGAFRLDSELQLHLKTIKKPTIIRKKPTKYTLHHSFALSKKPSPLLKKLHLHLAPLYSTYIQIQLALFNNQFKNSMLQIKKLAQLLQTFPHFKLPKTQAHQWKQLLKNLKFYSHKASLSQNTTQLRQQFAKLSQQYIRIAFFIGHLAKYKLFEVHCHTTSHKIQFWLQQQDQTIQNPYNNQLPHCGRIRRSFPSIPLKQRAIK